MVVEEGGAKVEREKRDHLWSRIIFVLWFPSGNFKVLSISIKLKGLLMVTYRLTNSNFNTILRQ